MAEFSRRLEVLFGARLNDVDHGHIEALVTNGVTEDFDLDFKSELYGNNDAAKRDLAGDVAALANTAGGVIVLGMVEDDQAKASEARPVTLSDEEVRRMRLIVASHVAPIPIFDVVAVRGDVAGEGYYLLVVPPSTSGPHGVLINNGFRYPVRNGSTIRYLSEPEIAAAYRERFRTAGERVERASELVAEAHRSISLAASWLVVALVPERAGQMEISQAGYVAFQKWASQAPNLQLNDTFCRWEVGLNRYIADGGNQAGPSQWVRFEAHSDGSGVYALQVTDENGSITGSVSELGDDTFAAGVLVGLRLLGKNAEENAHTSGPAIIRAELVAASPAAGGVVALPIAGVSPFPQPRNVDVDQLQPVVVSTTIEELTSQSRSALVAASSVINKLAQQFGIAEVAMLRQDGTYNPIHWNRTLFKHLLRWAADAGVEFTERA